MLLADFGDWLHTLPWLTMALPLKSKQRAKSAPGRTFHYCVSVLQMGKKKQNNPHNSLYITPQERPIAR